MLKQVLLYAGIDEELQTSSKGKMQELWAHEHAMMEQV